jgi:hypothetical protein
LRTYDISNPAQTLAIASRQTNNSAISRIAVAGTNAYLLEGTYGFHVYNISNPANPIDLAHLDAFAAFAHGLTAASNFVYLANDYGANGLLMYDVSNPSKPVRVGAFNNPGSAYDAAVSGNYLYLANGYDGLRIVGIVPQLRLGRTNNNRVVLSWPIPPAPDYALQQNSDLGTTNWLVVTNSRSVVSNRYQVVIPASNNHSFYRLKYP